MDDFAHTDRIVVVTGASRGIGREIATTFARAGATVALLDVDASAAEAAAQQLRQATGRDHGAFAVDVRDASAVGRVTAEVERRYGRIDVLVNNAGIAQNTAAEEMPDEEWRNVFDVNVHGVFFCSREFGKRMIAAGQGAIVNIASMSGMVVNRPQPQAHYNASKAAVIMLTKSLATEWARHGVRVNSVSPGYIGTEMTQAGLANDEWQRIWLDMTPMHRVGEPHDVAAAVQYLASDAARYVTGSNLVVDGGYTSW